MHQTATPVALDDRFQDRQASIACLSNPVLRVRNLAKSWRNKEIPVFKDVSFDVAAGESIALIGANGAGKSTLLRSCLRLVEPDSGQVLFGDEDIHRVSGSHLRHCRSRVGFVFQKHNLVPRLSVMTNVMHGALARGHGMRCWLQSTAPEAERKRAMECLEMVELAHLADRRADCLSGGQSQRVAIARALMQEPEFLFADEPVASLDPVAGDSIMALFRRLNKDNGLTLIFVSHQLDHALTYADRIIALKDGGIAIDGPASDHSLQSLRTIYD